jgi:hypothetical protein
MICQLRLVPATTWAVAAVNQTLAQGREGTRLRIKGDRDQVGFQVRRPLRGHGDADADADAIPMAYSGSVDKELKRTTLFVNGSYQKTISRFTSVSSAPYTR